MASSPVIAVLAAGVLLCTACHGPKHSSGRSDRTTIPTAFDHLQTRADYVEGNYERYLKSGRTTDEKAARALAGLEWDSHARRDRERNTDTMRWSSDDRTKRKQAQFEQELRDMGY